MSPSGNENMLRREMSTVEVLHVSSTASTLWNIHYVLPQPFSDLGHTGHLWKEFEEESSCLWGNSPYLVTQCRCDDVWFTEWLRQLERATTPECSCSTSTELPLFYLCDCDVITSLIDHWVEQRGSNPSVYYLYCTGNYKSQGCVWCCNGSTHGDYIAPMAQGSKHSWDLFCLNCKEQ